MDCPPLICNSKKPRIYWYQNDLEIVMRIMLHDVEDYYLKVKTDEFEFSTSLDGVIYFVNLHLFGVVVAEETSHSTTGREIKVRLPKVHKWAAWPRLLYGKDKTPQIFVDVERLEAIKKPEKELAPFWDGIKTFFCLILPQNTAREKNFSLYMKRNRIENIMPDVPSSNEEDSADENYNEIFEY